MSAINFPIATTSLFVNTLNTNKIIYLPAASTIGAGRLFYIKDICGNAANSSIYISTTGMDRIENRFQPSTAYAFMSTNYGSVLMAPDGALNWYFLQHFYKNPAPKYTPSTVTGGFTPLTVSGIGLQVWLDGADPAGTGTAPVDSSTVSTWVDKSGNGYNFTASSAATYSAANKALYFNNNYYTSSYTAAPVTETGFIVFKFNSTNTPQIIVGANNGGREFSGYNTFGYVGIIKSMVAWGQTVSGVSNTTTTLSTWEITSQTNTYVSVNGNLTLSGPTSIGTFTSGVLTGLGREGGSGGPVYGWVMEIVMFNTQLSQTNQQKMEGYLAWKWGIQTSLPSAHPYYSAAPTS